MADHLTYMSETIASRNILMQILFEILYTIQYFLLYIPGLFFRPSDVLDGDKRPVVLVSGFLGSPLAWYKVRKRLITEGHPVYCVRLGFQFGNIRRYSKMLQKFLEKKTITDCYLVCHSMGGLVATHMNYKGRDRTRKIFTLGTPYRGSLLTFIFPFTIASLQMNPFSKFIRETKSKYRTLTSVQAVFAQVDQIVLFNYYNVPGRFDDVLLPQVGHINLILGPMGVECISELIHSEESKDPRSKNSSKVKVESKKKLPSKTPVAKRRR